MTGVRWWGRLLDWQRDAQTGMWCTWHAGRAHQVVKLGRADAQAHGTTPGWHLCDDDPDARWYGVGPFLGTTLDQARRMAEAWIVCPYQDMAQSPKLHLAIAGQTVWWDDGLTIQEQEPQQRFALARPRQSPVAFLRPVFLGRGGGASVRWRAYQPATGGGEDVFLAGGDRWSTLLETVRADLREYTGGTRP